jgi:hypothetical protein
MDPRLMEGRILTPGETLSERRRMALEHASRAQTEADTITLANDIAAALGMPYCLNPQALVHAIETIVTRLRPPS